MKVYFIFLLIILLPCIALAEDLTFDSFEAAEAAAKKRASEYQKRMDDHIKSINENWEQQQKDLGADSASPDITKITTRTDGEKSSSNESSQNLENAVNSSVNKLKDQMISSAGPNSTGFAGGGAGYQWRVKFVNGKYVLSDSYNEAEFGTGKSKPAKPAVQAPETTPPSTDSGSSSVANRPEASNPGVTDGSAAPSASGSPVGTTPSAEKPAATSSTASAPPSSPADKPASPGLDPAPPSLPPPAIKLVIQHPTDFSEEIFSSNADAATPSDYKLEKFKIPEDTRIKIAVEVSKDINPEDVSLVITDDEGERAPVTSARMKNYRHMFRVPSEDKYSASVLINDKSKPGNHTKKLMQVRIPVTKVDFESRTIDNQRGSKTSDNSNSATMSSASTSSSGGTYTHSNSHAAQQVDLSDLYSDGSSTFNQAGQLSSPTNSSGSSGNFSSSYGSPAGTPGTSADYSDAGSKKPGYSSNNRSSQEVSGSAPGTSSRSRPASKSSDSEGNLCTDDKTTTSSSAINNEYDSDISYGDSGNNSSGSEGSKSSNDNVNYYNEDSAASDFIDSNYDANNQPLSSESGASGNSAIQGNFRIVSARGIRINDTNSEISDMDGNKQPQAASSENTVEDRHDPFIIALSLRNEKLKFHQSFDFIDQTSQISSAIPAGNEIIFNLTLGKKVDPASINIKLFDGNIEHKGNLQTIGESFACVFPSATSNSFVQLTGKADGQPFIYRLTIPVKK